jgi:hypothetical protein
MSQKVTLGFFPANREEPKARIGSQKERDRSCCHKRSKSREETPKEGIGGNTIAALQ